MWIFSEKFKYFFFITILIFTILTEIQSLFRSYKTISLRAISIEIRSFLMNSIEIRPFSIQFRPFFIYFRPFHLEQFPLKFGLEKKIILADTRVREGRTFKETEQIRSKNIIFEKLYLQCLDRTLWPKLEN